MSRTARRIATVLVTAVVSSVMALLAADEAVEAGDVTVSYAITDMSVVGPELHVMVENRSAVDTIFWIKPRVGSGRAYSGCLKNPSRSTTDPPAPAWEARRENPRDEVAGDAPALGVAHRVFALSNLQITNKGCQIVLQVLTEKNYQELPVELNGDTRARPLMSSDPPRIESRSQIEKDIINGNLLVRVIVRNLDATQFNVAIMDRRLICAQPGKATWNFQWDVPQGLSSGPGRLGPHGWIGFVHVVRVGDLDSPSGCTAEFDLGYEAFPTAYLPLGVVQADLEPVGLFIWSHKIN